MDTSQIPVIVAVASGISGAFVSVVSLILGLRKQKTEDKRYEIDEKLGITSSAGNLVSSANSLADLQEKVFDATLNQYKMQIDKLQLDVAALQKQAEINKEAIATQNDDIIILKNKTVKQQETITEQDTSIAGLKERDKRNTSLIKKLINGIDMLIAQIKQEGLVPQWTLAQVDLEV